MKWDDLCDYWLNMFGKQELITKKEACVFLNFKDMRTLNNKIKKGYIKLTVFEDGTIRVHKGDIFKFIKTNF